MDLLFLSWLDGIRPDVADFGFDGTVAEEEGEAVAGGEGGCAVGAVAVFEGDQEAAIKSAAGVGGFDAALQQVEGVQGVGVPVEHGVYQSDFECFKSTELRCGVGADGQMEPLDEGIEPPGLAREAVEEPVCEGGGRLDVGVCHHVHYVEIVVMADGRQDGERELRHVDREFIVVETDQIHSSATAAKDQDGVEGICFCGYLIEGADDTFRSRIALHHSRKQLQPEAETIFVPLELTPEIAPASSRRARDDGQAPREKRKRQLCVHIEHTFRFEPGDGALPRQFQFADGKGRVYVVDYERKAVKDRIAYLNPHKDRQARRQGPAGLGLEIRFDHPPGRGPDDSRRPGQQGVRARVFLDQGQIAVPGRVLLEFADFGLQPDRLEEMVFQMTFHLLLQGQ